MRLPDITTRLSTSGQLLVRSGIEIDRLLGAMVEDRATVSARLPSQPPFLAPLIGADSERRTLRIRRAAEEALISAVLAAPSVVLSCTHRGAQYAFSCARPRAAAQGSERAIELELPTTVLAVQPQRKPRAMQVPVQPQAYCRLWLGLLSFDAKVVDVGLDGSGILFADDPMPVCADTRFEARVYRAERAPLSVAVDVQRVTAFAPGARPRGTRIHCRFVAGPETLEELVRLFIINLR